MNTNVNQQFVPTAPSLKHHFGNIYFPDDWARPHLEDLIADDAPICYGILMPGDDVDGGVPVIKVSSFSKGSIDPSKLARTTPEIDLQYRRSRVLPDDILLGIRGTSGDVAVVPQALTGANITQDTARLRVNGDIHREYLVHALQSEFVQLQIKLNTIGQAVTGINIGEVRKLVIPAPRWDEQVALARILDSWKCFNSTMMDLIASKRRLRKAVVQQLLVGNLRFPLFNDSKPALVKLSALLSESRVPGSNGDTARKLTVKLYAKGVVPKQDIQAGSEATRYYIRRAGQFIYSKLDFLNGAFGIVPPELDGYETTLDLPAFDFKEGVDPAWFLYFVSRPDFYSSHLGLAHGGRKARRVNPHHFLNIVISLPSLAEQQRVARVIRLLDAEIGLLERQRALIEQQKRGLMQQLLTGKVRVPIPDRIAEAVP